MKKLCLKWCFYIAFVIAVWSLTNYTLLRLHPLEYYYTLQGMGLSLVVVIVQLAISLPILWKLAKDTNKMMKQ